MSRILRAATLAALLLAKPVLAAAQWTQLYGGPEGHIVSGLGSDYHTLFAGTAGPGNYFFVSTDQGSSWFIPDSTIVAVNSVAIGDSGSFAGTGGGGVYRSTDRGLHWTHADSGLTNTNVDVVVAKGTTLFAGTSGGGVFRSTDNGTSWSDANTGLTYPIITSMTLSGTSTFAGTYAGGVFVSSNNGAGWMPANFGLTQLTINDLAASGTAVFAGTGSGVFRTTTNGSEWTQTNAGLTDTTVTTFSVRGTNIFVGTQSGVFRSSNTGGSWTDVSSGLPPNYSVLSLAFDSTYFYAGLYYGGVWRRNVSEMITSVRLSPEVVPGGFSVTQNYPNPFNSTTTIHFSLPHTGIVTLSVFNMLGEEIATIVSKNLPVGNHQAEWNASRFPSGVYLYRLHAGAFTETKKLILLR